MNGHACMDFQEDGECWLCAVLAEHDLRAMILRDAIRYRWLRNQPGKPTPEEFDAAIDADMAADMSTPVT